MKSNNQGTDSHVLNFRLMSLRSAFRVVMFVTISCIKAMFGSSLPLVVCRRAHVLLRVFGSSLPLVVCRRAHVLFRVFGSSLPLVVCRRAHVLFTLFVFVYT